MKLFPLLLALVSALFISCERHEFEGPNGTKQLHEHHGAAHEEHAEGHGAHAEAGHGEGAAHEEKAAEGEHAPAPKDAHGH